MKFSNIVIASVLLNPDAEMKVNDAVLIGYMKATLLLINTCVCIVDSECYLWL